MIGNPVGVKTFGYDLYFLGEKVLEIICLARKLFFLPSLVLLDCDVDLVRSQFR